MFVVGCWPSRIEDDTDIDFAKFLQATMRTLLVII